MVYQNLRKDQQWELDPDCEKKQNHCVKEIFLQFLYSKQSYPEILELGDWKEAPNIMQMNAQ